MHTLPLGSLVTDGRRVGRLEAYRPANMADVRFTQTLNGAAFNVVERHPLASLLPVTVQPQMPRENPAKGLRKLIKVWEKTPQARPLLSVLRGVVLGPDFTPDSTQSIPSDFFPEALVDHKDVQLVIGRAGVIVLLAADSPRRGAGTIREAMRSGRRITLTGPRGGLAPAQRETLDTGAFAIPERRAWPINDRRHAEIAVQYMKRGFGKKSEYPRVKAAIRERYPDVPLSNPAPDVQDPENIQFRRVVAGVLRSLVRKEHGLRSPPRSEEMTAADLREEERLLLALPVATRKKLTSQAYAIATRRGQKHGWLVPGSQQPTEKAAQRSEERMLFDPLEQQKNRFYEVALASQRKSGFYRVVARDVDNGRRIERRFYIEPSPDPTRPIYRMTEEKAEAVRDEMNERIALGERPVLRNPMRPVFSNPISMPGVKFTPNKADADLAAAIEKAAEEQNVDLNKEPETTSPAAGRAAGLGLNLGAIGQQISQTIDPTQRLNKTNKDLLNKIITGLERPAPKGQTVNLMDTESPRPFWDIEHYKLVEIIGKDGQPIPSERGGGNKKMYALQPPDSPVTDASIFRYCIYLPNKVRFYSIAQRNSLGVSLLTPPDRIREELGMRSRGKRGEPRYTEETAIGYSQEARGTGSLVNVPRQILDQYFNPESISAMWERYRKEKNAFKKRSLIPNAKIMWLPFKSSDSFMAVQRGVWDEIKKKFGDKLSLNYTKYYTTNPALFFDTIHYYNTPGYKETSRAVITLQNSAREASSRAEQAAQLGDRSQTPGARLAGIKVPSSEAFYALSARTAAGQALTKERRKNIRSASLPTMEETANALPHFSGYDTYGDPGELIIERTDGLFEIAFLGPSALFMKKDYALAWLNSPSGRGSGETNLGYLIATYKQYMKDVPEIVLPATAMGVSLSAGAASTKPLEEAFLLNFVDALAQGQETAEARKALASFAREQARLPDLSALPPVPLPTSSIADEDIT